MYDEVVNLPANALHTPHWTRIATADGLFQYTLTGVLAPHLPGTSAQWHQRTLRAHLPLGGLGDGKKFTATQWAPAVSVAAINADAAPANPGWAVDGFELVDPNVASDQVVLDVQTAVRDGQCFLLRMTYHITLVGSIA